MVNKIWFDRVSGEVIFTRTIRRMKIIERLFNGFEEKDC